jgi:hypothetical protein
LKAGDLGANIVVMTELLQKAVATLSELPPEKQNAVAALVLEEIALEGHPDASMLSIDQLEEEARREYLDGKTELMSF